MTTFLAVTLFLCAAAQSLASSGPPHFLTPVGVSYPQSAFGYSFHPISYSSYSHHNLPYYGGIEYAPVSVKSVPAVHHLPAVADVPVTKIHAQHAVIQKEIAVARPAIKTSTFEVRRPAVQKHFFDVEERTLVRPIGSALYEFEEPAFRTQKGPAIVTSLEQDHAYPPVAHIAKVANVQQFVSTVAPPLNLSPGPVPSLTQERSVHSNQLYPYSITNTDTPPILPYDGVPFANHRELQYIQDHYQNQHFNRNYETHNFIPTTPIPCLPPTFIPAYNVPPTLTPVRYSSPSLAASYSTSSSTPVPYLPPTLTPISYLPPKPNSLITSTPKIATHDDTVVIDSALHSTGNNLNVETHSHGISVENKEPPSPIGKDLTSAQNHVNFLELLTGRGPITDVEISQGEVIDSGHSRARLISVTPAPNHDPVHEEVKTRRIVVSRPAQTLQDVNVVEPTTSVGKVTVNEPTLVKTASVGFQRVHTSVPVLANSFAPNYYANTHYYK